VIACEQYLNITILVSNINLPLFHYSASTLTSQRQLLRNLLT